MGHLRDRLFARFRLTSLGPISDSSPYKVWSISEPGAELVGSVAVAQPAVDPPMGHKRGEKGQTTETRFRLFSAIALYPAPSLKKAFR